MTPEKNYISINKESWNNKTDAHLNSEFYDLDGFMKGKNSLNSIELNLLGEVKGKTILHLQCHFGQDTISLNRLGAEVTGVDLSDKAIESARKIAAETNATAKFICCDIYDLPEHLDEQFNIVFTSYGTIGWLPDLDKWANVISHFLKPGGKFVFVEFHPYIWMYDDDLNEIAYSYFKDQPIAETKNSSYTDGEFKEEIESIGWNHGLGEVVNSLIQNGLILNSLNEYDYSPYGIFAGNEEFEKGKFRVKKFGNKIPLVYSITATKAAR